MRSHCLFKYFLFVLKNPGASHRDKTETLRHWRAPLFSRFAGKEASRYVGGSLLYSHQLLCYPSFFKKIISTIFKKIVNYSQIFHLSNILTNKHNFTYSDD